MCSCKVCTLTGCQSQNARSRCKPQKPVPKWRRFIPSWHYTLWTNLWDWFPYVLLTSVNYEGSLCIGIHEQHGKWLHVFACCPLRVPFSEHWGYLQQTDLTVNSKLLLVKCGEWFVTLELGQFEFNPRFCKTPWKQLKLDLCKREKGSSFTLRENLGQDTEQPRIKHELTERCSKSFFQILYIPFTRGIQTHNMSLLFYLVESYMFLLSIFCLFRVLGWVGAPLWRG